VANVRLDGSDRERLGRQTSLAEHGAEVDVFRIDLEDREVDPSGYDLIVSLGSEFAAFDDSHGFVSREARLMRRAVEEIRAQVGKEKVILGLSGGVDSSAATGLHVGFHSL
jgi:asparagine synthetase B (glutamine-hydrolysing)